MFKHLSTMKLNLSYSNQGHHHSEWNVDRNIVELYLWLFAQWYHFYGIELHH